MTDRDEFRSGCNHRHRKTPCDRPPENLNPKCSSRETPASLAGCELRLLSGQSSQLSWNDGLPLSVNGSRLLVPAEEPLFP